MTLFTVIYCRRSDGKLEIINKSKAREKNEPTKDQLDPKPDAKGVSDYYRILGTQDSKHLDWRRKLAGMLVKEVGGSDFSVDKAYILDDLPENYRLYEHVKTKGDSTETKPGKNHAGGGNDRQDAYLYGHPGGRKKRYRSPADFFPHLLWLCTDDTGDMMNCACKVCSPDELQGDSKAGAPVRGGAVAMKVENQVVGRDPIVQVTTRPTSTTPTAQAPAITRPPSTATAATTNTKTQRPPSVSAIPQPTSIDQQYDTSYGRLNYRLGEIVWFKNGTIWALGVVIRRWIVRNLPLSQARRYLIQPLAAPPLPQATKIMDADTDMRPWLAWSPPQFCHPGLNQGLSPTFGQMDWSALRSGQWGPSNDAIVIVDASILAARAIDATYTPFGMINATPYSTGVSSDANPQYTTHQIYWNGVYLGGEKIWLGDPVRLRMSANEDVMVVSQIMERPVGSAGASNQQLTPTKVVLSGNIFSCSTLPGEAVPADQQHLIPARMREDLQVRNQSINAIRAPKSYWKLMQNTSVDLVDIKGRWYETSIMAPIVNGKATYDDCVRQGITDSVARSFNARVEMKPTVGTRWETREASWGRAVPVDTKIIEGLDAPQPNEAQSKMQVTVSHSQQLKHDSTAQVSAQPGFDSHVAEHHLDQGDEMDQFMDLGRMESESMPGFEQEYESQPDFFS